MKTMPFHKYKPYPPVNLKNRAWPDKIIEKAPVWCSVDLRDGNQALFNPMNVAQKLVMFEQLVKIGFKEIEIGFPAASATELEFTRKLIEENRIPDDVKVQVLCQAREKLIEETFKALEGCKKVIFHLYNSTSEAQRRIVFQKDKKGIIEIATKATAKVKSLLKHIPECDFHFQYSPESFTGTELDFSLEICEAVMDVWEPGVEKPMILNLPATVEMSTPNIYADMIEWFCQNMKDRNKAIISIHTHNDRGCAVAATELALMAGGERVEGTLFGNGERTGNVDVVTLACNLFSQGVDPKLDFTDINSVRKMAKDCTEIDVHLRHPYIGDLVYTAFSGSHQDAIKKGIEYFNAHEFKYWEVPYLAIDPGDLGRSYEPIRINSQSGKSGMAFILETHYGYKLPKDFQIEFSKVAQRKAEETGKEVPAKILKELFEEEFMNIDTPVSLLDYEVKLNGFGKNCCHAKVRYKNQTLAFEKNGNGPVDAFVCGLKEILNTRFKITEFFEHALEDGSDARAACYIQITFPDGKGLFGAGIDSNTVKASFLAVLSSVNRALVKKIF